MNKLTVTSQLQPHASGQEQITVKLDGNLDNSTVGILEAKLSLIAGGRPVRLVFDLAGLKFITSAGIRVFLLTSRQQKQQGGHLSFVNLQPQIKEVFAIMGSIPGAKIFEDTRELDAYLTARQKAHEA